MGTNFRGLKKIAKSSKVNTIKVHYFATNVNLKIQCLMIFHFSPFDQYVDSFNFKRLIVVQQNASQVWKSTIAVKNHVCWFIT